MKLRSRTKVFYGIGGIADEAIYTLVITYQMFFLTQVAGLRPAAAGVIAAVGSVWETLCSPVIGYLSDNIRTRYGRRKPFILLFSIPAGACVALLFTVIPGSDPVKVLYYGVINVLLWQCFSLFFIPYIAWGSDLTEDYDERTSLRSYAYVGNQIGMTLAMTVPSLLVAKLLERGSTLAGAWQAVGLMVGIAAAAALLLCAWHIKETDDPSYRKPAVREKLLTVGRLKPMLLEYAGILKLKPARIVIACSMLYLVSNIFFGSGRVYCFTYEMGLSAGAVSLALLSITIAGVLLAPLLARISARTDKTRVFSVGIMVSGLLLTAAAFLPLKGLTGGIVLCLFFALGNTCYWQLMPSILYDVCEAEELASRSNHAGAVISTQALSESAAAAVGSALLGLVLQTAGFDETLAVQSAAALRWVTYSTTAIPGLMMVCVGLAMSRHTITKKSSARISEALALRRAGTEPDLTAFTDVYGKTLRGVKR